MWQEHENVQRRWNARLNKTLPAKLIIRNADSEDTFLFHKNLGDMCHLAINNNAGPCW